MTSEKLAEIKAKITEMRANLEGVTEGPWYTPDGMCIRAEDTPPDGERGKRICRIWWDTRVESKESVNNFCWIADIRTELPAVLDDIEELIEEILDLKERQNNINE